MNDNNVRGEQWKPLVADYFVKHYGGDYKKWMEANQRSVNVVMKQVNKWTKENIPLTYQEFKNYEDKTSIETMFSFMEIEYPPAEEYSKIWRELELTIPLKINSSFPGIKESINSLYSDGYTLYTSSGESSWLLSGYTTGMGIKSCFKTLYGPDLVQRMKTGIEFFKAILNHSRVNPKKTIVIDDKPELLEQLDGLGVFTIQACLTGEYKPRNDWFFSKANELPEIIHAILK